MPAATQGTGRSHRRSEVPTAPLSTSAQTATMPANATPITRWSTLTGWIPDEGSGSVGARGGVISLMGSSPRDVDVDGTDMEVVVDVQGRQQGCRLWLVGGGQRG